MVRIDPLNPQFPIFLEEQGQDSRVGHEVKLSIEKRVVIVFKDLWILSVCSVVVVCFIVYLFVFFNIQIYFNWQ